MALTFDSAFEEIDVHQMTKVQALTAKQDASEKQIFFNQYTGQKDNNQPDFCLFVRTFLYRSVDVLQILLFCLYQPVSADRDSFVILSFFQVCAVTRREHLNKEHERFTGIGFL